MIPRRHFLGPLSLFTSGPWEVVLPALIAGAIVAVVWIASPMRVAAVTDWRIAAVAGASLAAMIAVRLFARFWSDARGAWPFVLACAVAGGVLFASASQTLFAHVLERASDCAPLVATRESAIGRIVSFALPAAMWVAWLFYLLARFPRIDEVSHLMHGRESCYRQYTHALRVMLPVRLVVSALVVWSAVTPVTALRAKQERRLTSPHSRLRAAEERKALAHLSALELDAARASVRRCACDLLLPGEPLHPRIAAAEQAFRTIDREMDDWSFAWKPSAYTGAAIIQLLPLETRDLAWRDASPAPLPGAKVRHSDVQRVTYRRETLMLVRRSTIATVEGEALADISVKILGRSGRDQTLPDVISKRLKSAPSQGPCPLDGGSYCAAWNIGPRLLRLAPDDAEPVTPDAPLWLSLFDPAYFPASRAKCCA